MRRGFWINERCINCGTCWQFDPQHYSPTGDRAQVHSQPQNTNAVVQALLARQACPVAAIQTDLHPSQPPQTQGFPVLIDSHPAGDVHYCGWASRNSFGACSWLITRPDGNVMIDVPRWSAPLARRIKALGGLRCIVLTHRDDVAGHDCWARTFGCERWIHRADADAAPGAECFLEGDAPLVIAPELRLIPVPGHTAGSLGVLLGDRRSVFFSGDHLWWNAELKSVVASRNYCWWDFDQQLSSVRRLLDFDVALLLPGHGRRHRFAPGEWRSALEQTLAFNSGHGT